LILVYFNVDFLLYLAENHYICACNQKNHSNRLIYIL